MKRNPYTYEPLNKPMAWNTVPNWFYDYNEPDITGFQNDRAISRINDWKADQIDEQEAQDAAVAEQLGEDFSLDDAYEISKRVALESGDISRAIDIEETQSKMAEERERKTREEIRFLAQIDPELAAYAWESGGMGGKYGKTPVFEKPEKKVKAPKPKRLWNAENQSKFVTDDPQEIMAAEQEGFIYTSPERPSQKSAGGSKYSLGGTPTEKDARLGAGSNGPSIIERVLSGAGLDESVEAKRARLQELRRMKAIAQSQGR